MSSYAADILAAVKTALKGVGGLPPVKRRTRPVFWRDEKKVVLISLVSDEVDWETFKGDSATARRVINVKYTVQVTILVQRNDQYDEDPDDVLNWREQIRQKLYRPQLAGAATVWNCEVGLGQVYEYQSLDRAFDTSALTFIFHSKEPVHGQEYDAVTEG